MGDDVANHQFGHFVLLSQRQLAQLGGHGGRLAAQHHVRQIRRTAALHIAETQVQAVPAGRIAQPVEQLAHRVRAVLRMQQQVVDAGVAQLVVVVQRFAAHEPVAGRQAAEQVAGIGELAFVVGFVGAACAVDHAHQRLHLVDARAPGGGIDHQADGARRPSARCAARAGPSPGRPGGAARRCS